MRLIQIGLPHAIHITTTNITDRKVAIKMVRKNKRNLSRVENSLVDGGYTGEFFLDAIKELIRADIEVVKRNELHTFKVIPKLCVVESSFAWLKKFRRLWKNYKKKLSTSPTIVQLAFIRLLIVKQKIYDGS